MCEMRVRVPVFEHGRTETPFGTYEVEHIHTGDFGWITRAYLKQGSASIQIGKTIYCHDREAGIALCVDDYTSRVRACLEGWPE